MAIRPFRILPSKGPIPRLARRIGRHLPPANFITLHYAYFIGTCLLSALIFWGSATPFRSVSFTDSLYLVISAMTLAGLNTVNLSSLNTFQQFLLFLLIMLGSAIFVSAFVVHVRRKAFETKFRDVIEQQSKKSEKGKSKRRLSISSLGVRGRSITRTSETPLKPGEMNGYADQDLVAADPSETTVADNATAKDQDEGEKGGGQDTPSLNKSNSEQDDEPQRTILFEDNPGRVSESVERDGSRRAPAPAPLRIEGGITFREDTKFDNQNTPGGIYAPQRQHRRILSLTGVGARPNAGLHPLTPTTAAMPRTASMYSAYSGAFHRTNTGRTTDEYFPSSGSIARNSQFHGLTEEEREKLGGVEYRAVRLLAWLVPAYFILWQLLGCLALGAWVAVNRPQAARNNGLNPWWVGAFNAVSAFNNSGMSLLDANMVVFQTAVYMLITMGLLILAGNTAYPIFLRLIIWVLFKLCPDPDEHWAVHRNTLKFLLDHPRRCYTNLFPSKHTWWLLFTLVMLNGVDWVMFEILNIGNKAITSLPGGIEVLDGLFQALAVRSGGFYVVPIPSIRIALQVLYVVMMYISVYPVVITLRNTNVYEERSLGIYSDDPGFAAEPVTPKTATTVGNVFGAIKRTVTNHGAIIGLTPTPTVPNAPSGSGQDNSTSYFVRQQLRAQLSHDLYFLVLSIFIITWIETPHYEADPLTFSVFNIIFEVVSAYGCVGISVGLPNEMYSFSGAWRTGSKLVLCAVMLRGRHRGLPVAIDKAVLLPGEQGGKAEEEDARLRLERSVSRGRVV